MKQNLDDVVKQEREVVEDALEKVRGKEEEMKELEERLVEKMELV